MVGKNTVNLKIFLVGKVLSLLSVRVSVTYKKIKKINQIGVVVSKKIHAHLSELVTKHNLTVSESPTSLGPELDVLHSIRDNLGSTPRAHCYPKHSIPMAPGLGPNDFITSILLLNAMLLTVL